MFHAGWRRPEAGFFGLFVSAFLAATFIPVSSEAVFNAILLLYPQYQIHALAVATIGNSLGGVLMFYTGRIGSAIKPLNLDEKYRAAPCFMDAGHRRPVMHCSRLAEASC